MEGRVVCTVSLMWEVNAPLGLSLQLLTVIMLSQEPHECCVLPPHPLQSAAADAAQPSAAQAGGVEEDGQPHGPRAREG